MNLHQQVQDDIKLKCPLLFYRKISKNNSAIIEWGWVGYEEFCKLRRGVIHRGRLHPPQSAELFISYERRIQ